MSEQEQYTPPQEEQNVVRAEAAALSDDDLNMAMLAHLLGIITGFLGALIIWLMNKDKAGKEFVNDQAKEALNFQITLIIGYVAGSILSVVLIGFLLIFALLIANVVLCVLAALAARKGEAYRYPFTLRLLK
ncbi:MAG: DUF4870 domain-containing protein [Eikenella sp.]|nr:DUF4870 domain-containing protein [Eikenella sp.]